MLCYVTDRLLLPGQDPSALRDTLMRKIEAAASAGIDCVQLREKDLSGSDCASLAREAVQRAAQASKNRATPTRIIVNDRLDVALSEHAGGVHLGELSLPIAETRRLADDREPSANFLIGVSCHSLEAAKEAESGGADYIFFGPVFATPSKAAFGAPQGLQRLAEVCRAVDLPVVGIGGITLEYAASCISAGAAGIAAIRLFQDAQDLPSLIKTLRHQHR
jgi:thiamine-phosphate pyrophosphorylase